uniref:Putative VQ-like protein n=1 Tax=Davidia involucrata TaxID=16924 RepID=A0A5B6ZCW7_DAVIN
MEITSRPQERENPSPTSSPNSNGSSSNSNGVQIQTPPLTPKPISRSDTNPYPTTFVQADTTTFKQVVQMLTGSSETAKQASKPPTSDPPSSKGCIPPIKSTGQKKQGFKLYERRNQLKNGLMINPLMPGSAQNSGFSPRKPEILSPSILNFPSLVLSPPVTPLIEDRFNKSSPSVGNSSEEEKAIAEKGFYLHPSPRTTTSRDSEPQLLPLFPVRSPRVSGTSS